MSRSRVLRLVLAVWSFWFTGALLEAPGLHACGVHAASAGHSSHAPAVDHSAHHGQQDPAPADEPQCTCLGHCCGVAPTQAPATRTFAIDVAIEETSPVGILCDAAPLIERPFHRPFSNGPPTT